MKIVINATCRYCILIVLLSSLSGCRGNGRAVVAQPGSSGSADSLITNQELAIPLPAIPMMIQQPEERAYYFVSYFWQDLDFADSSYLAHPRPLEASFANFVGVALSLPVKKVRAAMTIPLDKACAPLLEFFLKMYEKYLYDPNSPMRNEEYYIPILEWAAASPRVSYATQVRLKDRLGLAMRNRVGNAALDFAFVLPDGSSSRLYHMQAENLLLVFYVPGCTTCNELIQRLRTTPAIEQLVQDERLRILFVDAEPDKEAWINEQDQIPSFVINAYNEDQSILTKQLYDLKASPTLYLLNARKDVVLKDTHLDRVLQQL